jgi:hypothetical protein
MLPVHYWGPSRGEEHSTGTLGVTALFWPSALPASWDRRARVQICTLELCGANKDRQTDGGRVRLGARGGRELAMFFEKYAVDDALVCRNRILQLPHERLAVRPAGTGPPQSWVPLTRAATCSHQTVVSVVGWVLEEEPGTWPPSRVQTPEGSGVMDGRARQGLRQGCRRARGQRARQQTGAPLGRPPWHGLWLSQLVWPTHPSAHQGRQCRPTATSTYTGGSGGGRIAGGCSRGAHGSGGCSAGLHSRGAPGGGGREAAAAARRRPAAGTARSLRPAARRRSWRRRSARPRPRRPGCRRTGRVNGAARGRNAAYNSTIASKSVR